MTDIAVRVIEFWFGIVIMDAQVTCTVGCWKFASAFEGCRVVGYGQSVLRLTVRFTLVTFDPQFNILTPALRCIVTVDYAGLESISDERDTFHHKCVVAVAVLSGRLFFHVRC